VDLEAGMSTTTILWIALGGLLTLGVVVIIYICKCDIEAYYNGEE
jgi:hypothetical protein